MIASVQWVLQWNCLYIKNVSVSLEHFHRRMFSERVSETDTTGTIHHATTPTQPISDLLVLPEEIKPEKNTYSPPVEVHKLRVCEPSRCGMDAYMSCL